MNDKQTTASAITYRCRECGEYVDADESDPTAALYCPDHPGEIVDSCMDSRCCERCGGRLGMQKPHHVCDTCSLLP